MNWSKCSPPSSPLQVDSLLLRLMQDFENEHKYRLTILSAFRSVEHEIKKGRDGSSSHCLGKAVDIYVENSYWRYLLIKHFLRNGINRIGVYKTFIHVDCALAKDGKTPNIIWYE